MKETLTQLRLIKAAHEYCLQRHAYKELFGITDGKAIGTFIEHGFQDYLEARFVLRRGSSALGIDLPEIETDIKVTSVRQPQSSSPFRSARQKIYGLGYHLLLFVYEKTAQHRPRVAVLKFVSCAFIGKARTSDYQITRLIRETLERDGNHDDIVALLHDRNLPGDEIRFNRLADEIMKSPPEQGFLTMSNALQWRLQYARILTLTESVDGIVKIV